MKDSPYSANGMSLTPAFTPETALIAGSGMIDVSMVGQYVPPGGYCAPMPPAPCGGSVQVGMINSIYTPGNATTANSSGLGSVSSTSATEPQHIMRPTLRCLMDHRTTRSRPTQALAEVVYRHTLVRPRQKRRLRDLLKLPRWLLRLPCCKASELSNAQHL